MEVNQEVMIGWSFVSIEDPRANLVLYFAVVLEVLLGNNIEHAHLVKFDFTIYCCGDE
jgi:hypothetical protein